ncbi:DDE-type integrase/transposase/recombinase [Asaia siamensis]|uniref:DDE-type integrase/transposase/recombinase n=1 Tax=Asaia siamensis TaxID=110479 RepID=UPI00353128BF
MIRGQFHRLWVPVDHEGYVLDEILLTRRNIKAARRLLIQLSRQQSLRPSRMSTEKARS